MASFETSPTKLLLISAAASLAALGIVMVASSVPAPAVAPVAPTVSCVELAVESPPPPPPPPIVVEPRPLPPPSK